MQDDNTAMYENEILFLGGLFPSELYSVLTDCKLNKNIQNAANVLQWHIVDGLENNLKNPIKIINAPYVGAFPMKCKIGYIKKIFFSHKKDAKDINIGFLNLPFIRQIMIFLNSCKYLKKWAESNNAGISIAYALTLRNVCELIYVKKINPNVKTCIIVPDLPMYMRMSKNIIYTLLKSVEIKLLKCMMNRIDGYVLLTKHMNNFIKADKYCVVEGIATKSESTSTKATDKKIIFYSGGLEEKYGVLNLINAFERITDDGYRLYICGHGNCENYIKNMAQKDNRICYLGQIERDKVISYQKKSTVLVNPRQNTGDFTKYSFPSKNLEYLSSGVPLVAYKLEGIPEEYDNYILYVENNDIETLKDKLVEVCNYSDCERQYIGQKAKDFVLSEKNATSQGKKIIDFAIGL